METGILYIVATPIGNLDEEETKNLQNSQETINKNFTRSRLDSSRRHKTYIKIIKSFRNIKTNDKLS